MRVVIVDDHVMFRDFLARICERELGHQVVGTAGLGQEAIELSLARDPDVLLHDLALPDVDGFDVTKAILKAQPQVRIVAVSAHVDDSTLYRVEKSGMVGFVDKETSMVETLKAALEAVAHGKTYFTTAYHDAKKRRNADTGFFTKILSKHECAYIALAGQGLSDVEIAPMLNITVRTAEKHRSNILHKLNLRGTPKLIAFAIEHGLVINPRI